MNYTDTLKGIGSDAYGTITPGRVVKSSLPVPVFPSLIDGILMLPIVLVYVPKGIRVQ